MGKMFTLFLMLNASYCFAQFADTSGNILICKTPGLNMMPTNKDTSRAPVRIRFHCLRTLTSADEPLFVVDGIPFENRKFSNLKLEDIDSIWILKGATASAIYGLQGANGVIIITTKGTKLRKIIIKDFSDGSRIAGATVSFMSITGKNDKMQLVADDSGIVTTDKLKKSAKYRMSVSAVGHQTLEEVFENNYYTAVKEILLRREIKTCPEVVVTCFDCVRTIRCGFRIRVTRSREIPGVEQMAATFKVFPNPISKGGTVNLEFNNDKGFSKIIRIVSLDGKTLLEKGYNSNEGKNVFQLPIDARWSTGIYFVQLLYENGQVVASEKVIVQ